MDESTFETFEEELGKPLQEVPPQKPVRQTRTGGRAAASLRKNLTQIETPWEGVTLNRCLIAAIAVLLLSCGLQRINGKSKRATRGRASRGLRHRALPDLRLLKKRETKFTERRRRGRQETDENKEKLTTEKEMKVKKKVKEVEEEEEDMEKMKKPKKPEKESKQKPMKKENQ